VAVNALREIDVYPAGDFKMTLGEYLLMRGELHEFLMANLLHDLGHPPLSHVLEINPFIELDHEEITRNLILGENKEGGEIDWYVAEYNLLASIVIREFIYKFKNFEKYDNFLDYLKENKEILKSRIVTVTDVLGNFGVDKKRVVEILSGKVFCPSCGKLTVEIKDDKVECGNKECKDSGRDLRKKIEEEEIGKIYDIQFLNKLVDSDIDFDRIDHVKRDSDICGLSLTSFRLLELLGSISIVLPDSNAHKEVYEAEENKPYIFVSEDGLKYVMDLLNTRRLIFNEVLYSDENNWINGVVNQITALAIRFLPHLRNVLPFITDQILAYLYMNEMFIGTQIEKLIKLFYLEFDHSCYKKPKRFKLKRENGVSGKNIEKLKKAIYEVIEKLNEEHMQEEIPAIVFYTNIGGKYKEEGIWDDSLVYGVKFGNNYYKFRDLSIKEKTIHEDTLSSVRREIGYIPRGRFRGKFYNGTERVIFPQKPSEQDIKDLLYIWVSDFTNDDIWERLKKEFGRFVDLDRVFVDLDKVGGDKNEG